MTVDSVVTTRTSEPSEIAVRAWAVPRTAKTRGRKRSEPRLPKYLILLDTETRNDAKQRLTFGVFRYCRVTRGSDGIVSLRCLAEGLFHADELPRVDPAGFARLQAYVRSHRRSGAPVAEDGARLTLDLISRSELAMRVLWRGAYEMGAAVGCFNLPFDLSRLAVHVGHARRSGKSPRFSYYDGFSFALWGRRREDGTWQEHLNRPRIQLKALDSKRSFEQFTKPLYTDPENLHHNGVFIDVRTLAYALTDQSHSLESACKAYGIDFTKRDVEHGTISEEYIDYCREDVRATQLSLEAMLREFDQHPIDLPVHRAYSSASIGKAYLRAMGIKPVLERQSDICPQQLGEAMSGYFGGRAEVRIRRTPIPIAVVDFLSMYPTVCSLTGIWQLLTAKRIEFDDTTDDVRELVRSVSASDCFDPRLWRSLIGFALVDPNGATLPARTGYAGGQNLQIGVNPLTSDGPLWYAIADIVAAVLIDPEHPPTILKASRLRAVGQQTSLRSTELLGQIPVDPGTTDFFREIVQARQQVKHDASLSESEREARSRGLKVLANATGYGIYAQMTRQTLGDDCESIDLFAGGEPFTAETSTPEDPGEYAFPPIAACITSCARLMLALLEHEVHARGGSYALMDTDSCFIVANEHGGLISCDGGPHRAPDGTQAVKALSWAEVDEIRDRFEQLHPYNRSLVKADLLELEKDNFDTESGERVELYCYAISAKRYPLYRLVNGAVQIVRASEHGLGHLLSPIDPDDIDEGKAQETMINDIWRYLIERELGRNPTPPAWFALPAVQRITVSRASMYDLFQPGEDEAGERDAIDYAERIKPHNFLLTAIARSPRPANSPVPVAPFETDAAKWETANWIDRRTGTPIQITTDRFDGLLRPGVLHVQTFADVVHEFNIHPEPKSLAPNGTHCLRNTRGLLKRRPVHATDVRYIGKEANELEAVQQRLVADVADVRNEYRDARRDLDDLRRNLKSLSAREVARQTEIGHSAVSDFLRGRSTPHATNLDRYRRLAEAINNRPKD